MPDLIKKTSSTSMNQDEYGFILTVYRKPSTRSLHFFFSAPLGGMWSLNQMIVNPTNIAILKDAALLAALSDLVEDHEDDVIAFEQGLLKLGFVRE